LPSINTHDYHNKTNEKATGVSLFKHTPPHTAPMLPRLHLLLALLTCAAAMTAVTTQIYPNNPSDDIPLQPIDSSQIYGAAGLPDEGANVLRSETHENLLVVPPSTIPITQTPIHTTTRAPQQTPPQTPTPPPQEKDATTTTTVVIIAAVLGVAVVGGITTWCLMAAPQYPHSRFAAEYSSNATAYMLVRMTAADRPEIAVKIM